VPQCQPKKYKAERSEIQQSIHLPE
jgi:hypothetical protein